MIDEEFRAMYESGGDKKKGYVAFLDILGFSELISSGLIPDFREYFNIMESAVKGPHLQYVTFSDSIVINTKGQGELIFSSGEEDMIEEIVNEFKEEEEESLFNLIKAVSNITYRFLTELNVPIRGCISYGNFYRVESDEGDVMIAGTPIIDAYHYEKNQNWIGVMLSPRVIKSNEKLQRLTNVSGYQYQKSMLKSSIITIPDITDFDLQLLLEPTSKIPFHQKKMEERNFKGIVVIPQKGCGGGSKPEKIDFLLKHLTEYENKLNEMSMYASDPEPQKKYFETSKFIRNLRLGWNYIKNPDYSTYL